MLLNCGVGEGSWESLGLDCKEMQPVHPKENQFWLFIGTTDAKYFGHLMQRTDSFEKTLMLGRIEVGGEADDRGWDGWTASPTQWTGGVWVNSGSWWWTRRHGVLQSMRSQRAGHDGATEINWTELNKLFIKLHGKPLVTFSGDNDNTELLRAWDIGTQDLW